MYEKHQPGSNFESKKAMILRSQIVRPLYVLRRYKILQSIGTNHSFVGPVQLYGTKRRGHRSPQAEPRRHSFAQISAFCDASPMISEVHFKISDFWRVAAEAHESGFTLEIWRPRGVF